MNELRGDARTVQDENRVGQDLRRLYRGQFNQENRKIKTYERLDAYNLPKLGCPLVHILEVLMNRRTASEQVVDEHFLASSIVGAGLLSEAMCDTSLGRRDKRVERVEVAGIGLGYEKKSVTF